MAHPEDSLGTMCLWGSRDDYNARGFCNLLLVEPGFEPSRYTGIKTNTAQGGVCFLFWRTQKDSNPQPSDP